MKILVLGASGMLGNAVLRTFAESPGYEVVGTVRSSKSRDLLPTALHQKVVTDVDVENIDYLTKLMTELQPDAVINCVGMLKQMAASKDPLLTIPINTLFPHRLAHLCGLAGARLVHMSTDCVFDGQKGNYVEEDPSDAKDLYGQSKYWGEVNYQNTITLRTSIIGHELNGARSLIDWFLSQSGEVNGYRRAVFSGLPTVEIARLIRDHVLPNPALHGLYHVSADPIDKFTLLSLVAEIYGKAITVIPEDDFVIDRSLDSTRFRDATGFHPKPWPELVTAMRDFS